MRLRPIAVALAALLIFATAPASLAAPSLAAIAKAPAVRAKILFRDRKFEEALAILRPLVRERTVQANILFLYGIAATEAAQKPGLAGNRRETLLDVAIASFRSMLVHRPDLVRVRLELARAFFLKGEDTLATGHFEQVLAGKPPAGVALNVNRFLNIMRARKRWSLRVGAALLPDTNIGAGSDERIIYIDVGGARLPFRRNQEEARHVRHRRLGLAGGRVPVPAVEPVAAAWGRRHRAPGVPDQPVRPAHRLRPCRAALADRPGERGEPAAHRAAPVDRLGAGGAVALRCRRPRRGAAPADAAYHAHRASLAGRTPLRHGPAPSRRADRRCLARHLLGGLADAPLRRVDRLGARAARARTLSQFQPPGTARGHRGSSPGGSPWAARGRCAGPTGRAAGSPSSRAAGSART